MAAMLKVWLPPKGTVVVPGEIVPLALCVTVIVLSIDGNMVTLTGMFWGEVVAPEAATVILSFQIPVVILFISDMFNVSVTLSTSPVELPLAGLAII